jgi:hypothetical protein
VVKFSAADEFEDWIENKPREWARIIAARAALRAVPILASSLRGILKRRGSDHVLFPFYLMTPGWMISAWPKRASDPQIRNDTVHGEASLIASRAHDYLVSTAAAVIYFDVVHASMDSYTVAVGYDAYYRAAAASTVNRVCAAAAEAYGFHASNEMLSAVSADATALDAHEPIRLRPKDLSIQELWPTGIPRWASEDWALLKIELFELDEDWNVWTNWYEAPPSRSQDYGVSERSH